MRILFYVANRMANYQIIFNCVRFYYHIVIAPTQSIFVLHLYILPEAQKPTLLFLDSNQFY